MLGLPVLAVLSGRVAGIIRDREPYGNAIIIETSLDVLPADRLTMLMIPTPAPTVQPAASLFCPAGKEDAYDSSRRSLYLLYAHLNKTPEGSIGDQVSCGQPIGEVGTSGKSVNAHLHLETRVGPADATFLVMAHYENDASTEEMHTYCTWRVSGLFQMFDPLNLLNPGSSQ
ncbi:MAG: M23 family metallopeptidase [Anaerolineaceae bacterium]|nr:M23 family metallopeptidase [Anaerolineaceae bacterium]